MLLCMYASALCIVLGDEGSQGLEANYETVSK